MTDETKNPETPETQAAAEAPAEQPQAPLRKQVIFLEGGQVAWPPDTFTTLDEVSSFLQQNVYQDWSNGVFENIMTDLRAKATQSTPTPEQAPVPEQAPEQPVVPTPPLPEAPQPLQVVPKVENPESPEEKMARLEAELAALKAK